MSETTGGDREGQASPSKGGSTQGTPEPEVIEVALGTDLNTLPNC